MPGSIFTGKKEGCTDKSIFLPATGHRNRLGLYQYKNRCSYMSSHCNSPLAIDVVYIEGDFATTSSMYLRSQGLPVRAVWE